MGPGFGCSSGCGGCDGWGISIVVMDGMAVEFRCGGRMTNEKWIFIILK